MSDHDKTPGELLAEAEAALVKICGRLGADKGYLWSKIQEALYQLRLAEEFTPEFFKVDHHD